MFRFETPCIPTRWQVSAEWSRFPGTVARRARDGCFFATKLSRAGSMPARIGNLSAGVGRRHPVAVRKASFYMEEYSVAEFVGNTVGEVRDPWNTGTEETFKLLFSW